jgi:hypothetical protein
MSATLGIVSRPHFKLFKSAGAFLQGRQCGRACAGAFCLSWDSLGQFQSRTIDSFSFSFSARIKGFLETCRKMLKMQDQFY